MVRNLIGFFGSGRKTASSTTLVRLHDVVKSYENSAGQFDALKGINFEVARGEFVAVMGPSGSGKSTLLHIVGCLDQVTAGDYFLDGLDVGRQTHKILSKLRSQKLGFVFQQSNLLPRLSAVENVELQLIYQGVGEEEARARALATLSMVGLEDRADHFPNMISGGEQQRVAIARALSAQPDLLLADEPTGSLDRQTGGAIIEEMKSMNRENGQTILMVTHDHEVAQMAQRIVHMRDGQIE